MKKINARQREFHRETLFMCGSCLILHVAYSCVCACNRRGPKLILEIRNICHVYTSLVFPVTLGVTVRCPCLSEDNSVLISGGLEGLSTSRAGTNVWMQRAQRFHGSCGDFRLDSGSGGFSDPSYVSPQLLQRLGNEAPSRSPLCSLPT